MKRLWICLLSLMLLLSCAAAEETTDNINWNINEDGTLSVWFLANESTGYQWSCELSDPLMLNVLSEEYAADTTDAALTGQGGIWAILLGPADGQAGLVTLSFLYAQPWSDEPGTMHTMEVYEAADGTLLVISVDDTVLRSIEE